MGSPWRPGTSTPRTSSGTSWVTPHGGPGTRIGRRLDYLFKGITETETAPRLILAEPFLGGTGYEMFIDQEGTDPTGYEWLQLSTNALYSYEDNSVEEFDGVWDQAGATTYPVWDSEPPYAAAIDKYGGNVRQQLRERNYAVFIRGGCGINYGDEDWWRFGKLGFYDGGLEWFEVPDAAPSIEAQYAWTVLDKYVEDPTWDPDGGTFVTTGLGSGDTKAASGFSDTAALAYCRVRAPSLLTPRSCRARRTSGCGGTTRPMARSTSSPRRRHRPPPGH